MNRILQARLDRKVPCELTAGIRRHRDKDHRPERNSQSEGRRHGERPGMSWSRGSFRSTMISRHLVKIKLKSMQMPKYTQKPQGRFEWKIPVGTRRSARDRKENAEGIFFKFLDTEFCF